DLWPRRLSLHQGHRPRHARVGEARLRHDRPQPRARLGSGGAVRRHATKRHRPRRVARGAQSGPPDAVHFCELVMVPKRVLHLAVEREWFDDIAEGRKRHEYRAYKEYWKKRLEGKEFDIVRFRNGYAADAPEMDVEFVGVERKGKNYVIRLGQVLKKKRWRRRG